MNRKSKTLNNGNTEETMKHQVNDYERNDCERNEYLVTVIRYDGIGNVPGTEWKFGNLSKYARKMP